MNRQVKTASGEVLKLKTSFKRVKAFEVLYTGGKVVLSGNGKFLVSLCGETIKIVHVETGAVIKKIDGDGDTFTCFALSADDSMLVTASRNLIIKVWNIEGDSDKPIRSFKALEGPISTMCFHPSGTLLATGSSEGTIKVWDVKQGYITHNFVGSQGVVGMLKFSPEASKFLLFSAADIDCKVRVWSLLKKKEVRTLSSHVGTISDIAFSESGSDFYTAGRDNIINVWSGEDYSLKKTIPVYESVEGVEVLPGKWKSKFGCKNQPGDVFITAGNKGRLRMWSSSSGEVVYEEPLMDVMPAITLTQIIPKLHKLVTVTYDHNILVRHFDNFNCPKQIIGYNDEIVDMKFVDPEDRYVAMATNSEQLRLVELETGDSQLITGHTDIAICIDVFKKGELMVSSSKDGTARIWRTVITDTGKLSVVCVGICSGHIGAVGACAGAPRSSKFIVTGSQDLTVKLWDTSTLLDQGEGAKVQKLTAKFTQKAHDKDINAIAIAPNDSCFATGSQDKTAKIWNASDLSLMGVAKGHKRGVWCVQFSPVDRVFATSSGDKTIKIWSLADFSCLKTFEGHTNSVLKFAFVTKGMQMVSSGSDGLCKLWTVKTNECLDTMDGHVDKVWALCVGAKEDTIVSGGGDSVINVWKDFSEIEEEHNYMEEELRLEREQDLANACAVKDYVKAMSLALTLDSPGRLLAVVGQLLSYSSDASTLEAVVLSLNKGQLAKCLKYIRDWNTNSKFAHTAQCLLHAIFKQYPAQKLIDFFKPTKESVVEDEEALDEIVSPEEEKEKSLEGNSDSITVNIKEIIEGLIPYTERHLERRNRLMQDVSFIDYVWQSMKVGAINPLQEDKEVTSSTEKEKPKRALEGASHMEAERSKKVRVE